MGGAEEVAVAAQVDMRLAAADLRPLLGVVIGDAEAIDQERDAVERRR